MQDTQAIVLAAGKGTRMGGDTPKVLREIAGKPIIFWSLTLLKELGINKPVVVVGYKSELVKQRISEFGFDVIYAEQPDSTGTGDSVRIGLDKVEAKYSSVLVLFADDSALYKSSTIREFINQHISSHNKSTFLVIKSEVPLPIGGLLLDINNDILKVVTKDEMIDRGISENFVLCGAFVFNRNWLAENIIKIKPSLTSGEYPLPGLISVALENKEFIKAYQLKDSNEWNSVNTPEELQETENKKLTK